MKRGFFSSTILLLSLALSAWAGASPRVWCLGPDGHLALESALSECCAPLRGDCSSSQSTPRSLDSASGVEAGLLALSTASAADKDSCVDSAHQAGPTRSGANTSAHAFSTLEVSFTQPLTALLARPLVPWTGLKGFPLHRPTPYQLRTILLI